MVEDLGKILGKGFNTWKDNLNICLPFVFNVAISGVLSFLIIGTALLITMPSLFSYFNYYDEFGSLPGPIFEILPEIFQNLAPIFIAAILTIILIFFITAFFTSGAIGMAKEATISGRVDFSVMSEYGRKKFINLFFANLIVGLILSIGLVFLIPGIFFILPYISTFSGGLPDIIIIRTIITFAMGFLCMGIYMVIIGIIFSLTPYAVVIDDLGAVEGVKKGFRFFMNNKIDVFSLFIIVFVVGMVAGAFGSIPYIGGVITMAISAIIIQPLSTVWWTRLYLSN